MKSKKAQVTLEVGIFIFCLAAALVAMSVYIKRGVQGKIRDSADKMGALPYAEGKTSGTTTRSMNSRVRTEFYSEVGSVPLPAGGTAQGKQYYTRQEVLEERSNEAVDERININN